MVTHCFTSHFHVVRPWDELYATHHLGDWPSLGRMTSTSIYPPFRHLFVHSVFFWYRNQLCVFYMQFNIKNISNGLGFGEKSFFGFLYKELRSENGENSKLVTTCGM